MFVAVVFYLCKSTATPQTGDNSSGCKTNVVPILRTQAVFAGLVSTCVVWCSDGRAMYGAASVVFRARKVNVESWCNKCMKKDIYTKLVATVQMREQTVNMFGRIVDSIFYQ